MEEQPIPENMNPDLMDEPEEEEDIEQTEEPLPQQVICRCGSYKQQIVSFQFQRDGKVLLHLICETCGHANDFFIGLKNSKMEFKKIDRSYLG